MLIVILHNGLLQGVSTLITEVTFCRWNMRICQHFHIMLVLSYYYCHVTICPVPDVTVFHFQCLAFEIIWHSLAVWFNCTSTVYFLFC